MRAVLLCLLTAKRSRNQTKHLNPKQELFENHPCSLVVSLAAYVKRQVLKKWLRLQFPVGRVSELYPLVLTCNSLLQSAGNQHPGPLSFSPPPQQRQETLGRNRSLMNYTKNGPVAPSPHQFRWAQQKRCKTLRKKFLNSALKTV